MLKNLYTFSKSAWHAKLFKWVYGTDPTITFNTMCPYFWSMVATLLLFPLILIIKLFGKSGTALLKTLESRRRDNIQKAKDNFIKRCQTKMTDKEAYALVDSKCWKKHYWDIDYDLYNKLREQSNDYVIYLKNLQREKDKASAIKREKYVEFKESKLFTAFAYTVSTIMSIVLILALYVFISSVTFPSPDWDVILEVLKVFGFSLAFVALATALYRYIIKPIGRWLECIKLPECRLCKLGLGKYIAAPFVFVGKGIVIIGDMIYMSYKKACPRITWKSEE